MSGEVDAERPAALMGSESAQSLADRPPRWLFHGLLAVATLPVLWAASFPGSSTGWLLLSILLWFCFGVVWLTRLALYMKRRRRMSWWFAVAPLMFAALVAVAVSDLPLRVRWAGSNAAFDAAVAALPAGDEFGTDSQTIGAFTITSWERVPGGVIFREAHGAVFSDAGFAYLPDGPSDDMDSGSFESPEFRSLGGPWYAWTASW